MEIIQRMPNIKWYISLYGYSKDWGVFFTFNKSVPFLTSSTPLVSRIECILNCGLPTSIVERERGRFVSSEVAI